MVGLRGYVLTENALITMYAVIGYTANSIAKLLFGVNL
jgi:hypothetical protein